MFFLLNNTLPVQIYRGLKSRINININKRDIFRRPKQTLKLSWILSLNTGLSRHHSKFTNSYSLQYYKNLYLIVYVNKNNCKEKCQKSDLKYKHKKQ